MNKHRLFCMVCMAFALVTTVAFSQTSVGKTPSPVQSLPLPLQATLKDIPVAGASCRNEDFVARKSGTVRGSEKQSDPACAISLEQLSASLGKSELVLIDIRQKAEFDRMHIDGAVNFSASEIRIKRYLSNKLVVLLGNGKADQDLYDLCSELKGVGFKQTKVLRGGMLSWLLENKPVIGSSPSFTDLASLSPDELFRESKIAGNFIIGLPETRKLAELLQPNLVTSSDNFEDLKVLIQKRKKGKPVHNVVLVADENFNKSRLAELAKAVRPEPLLIYAGSETSYREFLRSQKAMWDKQAKGPARPRCGAL